MLFFISLVESSISKLVFAEEGVMNLNHQSLDCVIQSKNIQALDPSGHYLFCFNVWYANYISKHYIENNLLFGIFWVGLYS